MGLIRESPMIRLLREERFDEFNDLAKRQPPDLRNADLRMIDLQRAHLAKADLRGAYLRNADLRGVDLSGALMTGASIHDARISGCLFPADVWADEITLSIVYGTRIRTRP